MSNSYVSNHVHVVFSTKERMRVISEELQLKLWAYLAGIAKNHDMHAVAVGGVEDHVHALLDLGAMLGVAKAVQTLKANSSRWMNEQVRARFAWQEGYFACSVSGRRCQPSCGISGDKKSITRRWMGPGSSCCC